MPIRARGWILKEPGKALVREDVDIAAPGPSEAVVEVLACGLCHTDLGFATGAVAPRHPLPLVLGHEIVGTVVETAERFGHLMGCPVLVPAVLPCGDCAFCRAGRS